MVKVKAYYCKKLIKEVEMSEDYKGLDIAIEFHKKYELDLSKITHFLVWYENEWIYGNDYDNRRKKLELKS